MEDTGCLLVRSGDPDPGGYSNVPQAAGGCVAVHPGTAAVEQDRPASAGADTVDGPPGRRRHESAPISGHVRRLQKAAGVLGL
jgi:hypothetical protein